MEYRKIYVRDKMNKKIVIKSKEKTKTQRTSLRNYLNNLNIP
jgi:hypothetical protein